MIQEDIEEFLQVNALYKMSDCANETETNKEKIE